MKVSLHEVTTCVSQIGHVSQLAPLKSAWDLARDIAHDQTKKGGANVLSPGQASS